MRLATVIGRVTLTKKEPAYEGGRLLIVQPLSREQFAGAPGVPLTKGSTLVVYDQLGAREGCIIGYTDGAEASQPFPGDAPVDAYAACIVQHLDYHPPR